MNYGYGYDPTPHDKEIAKLITEMLEQDAGIDARGHKAYVETDQLYRGVRIHRLTHYTDDEIKNIVRKADAIVEFVLRKHGVIE